MTLNSHKVETCVYVYVCFCVCVRVTRLQILFVYRFGQNLYVTSGEHNAPLFVCFFSFT